MTKNGWLRWRKPGGGGDVSGELVKPSYQGIDKYKDQRAGEQKPWLAIIRKWCVSMRGKTRHSEEDDEETTRRRRS